MSVIYILSCRENKLLSAFKIKIEKYFLNKKGKI
jgi:hypothetical protein